MCQALRGWSFEKNNTFCFRQKKKSHISLLIYETKREHGFSQALGRDMGFWSPQLEPEPPRAGSASAAFGVNVLLSGGPQGQLRAAVCFFCQSHHPFWTPFSPFWNTASPLDVPVCQTVRLSSTKAQDQRDLCPLRSLLLFFFSPSDYLGFSCVLECPQGVGGHETL